MACAWKHIADVSTRIFKYEDLPDGVKKDIKIHFEKQKTRQKTVA